MSKIMSIFAKMNTVVEHIEYLIRNYDCVIVPNLGGFVAQHIPAYFDEKTGTYFPPRRCVVFNTELSHNDGLLSTSVSRKEKISFEDASKFISSEVSTMRAQLMNDGSIAIGHIGRLDYVDDKIVFCANDAFVSTPQYFGLKPLSVTPVDTEETAENKSAKKKLPAMHRKAVYATRVAAAIVVFILCGLLFSTPISVDQEAVKYASLALPEIKKAEPVKIITGELCIACPDKEEATGTVKAEHKRNIKINLDDPFYLVVSSLATKSQAEEFVSYTKGYNLEIVETSTGKYRVIVASGSSAAEVMEYTHNKNFAEKFPNAWPCHK